MTVKRRKPHKIVEGLKEAVAHAKARHLTIEEHGARITSAADALLAALSEAKADGYSISDYSNGHGHDLRYELAITVGSVGEAHE